MPYLQPIYKHTLSSSTNALFWFTTTESVSSIALMQFCTTSMSAIMKLIKHGAIIRTHTQCLVIANMTDTRAVRNCISTLEYIYLF